MDIALIVGIPLTIGAVSCVILWCLGERPLSTPVPTPPRLPLRNPHK